MAGARWRGDPQCVSRKRTQSRAEALILDCEALNVLARSGESGANAKRARAVLAVELTKVDGYDKGLLVQGNEMYEKAAAPFRKTDPGRHAHRDCHKWFA